MVKAAGRSRKSARPAFFGASNSEDFKVIAQDELLIVSMLTTALQDLSDEDLDDADARTEAYRNIVLATDDLDRRAFADEKFRRRLLSSVEPRVFAS